MASDAEPRARTDLTASHLTIPSDSENYGNTDALPSPSSATSSPMILYKPPTVWSLVRGTLINLVLPFVNGLMLGFGELFAHEIAFRAGWSQTKVFPHGRSRPMGPGVEIRQDPLEARRRRDGDLQDMTALE